MTRNAVSKQSSTTKILRYRQALLAALTNNCCPDLDRVLHWVRNPLGILVLTASSALLVGFYLHPHGFVFFFGALAIFLIGVGWPWLSMRGIRATLSFEGERGSEGQLVRFRVRIYNRLPWAVNGLVLRGGWTSDSLSSEASTVLSIAVVRGIRSTDIPGSFTPQQRGVYPRTEMCISTGFPFGLCQINRPVAVEQELVVWPRMYPVAAIPDCTGKEEFVGSVSPNRPGHGGDILGARPYRRGDSPRRIHWAQSARHDRLIVSEMQSFAHPLIQIVLDTHPSSHASMGPTGSREWAIRVAASLATGWLEQGAEIEVLVAGQRIKRCGGSTHRRRILDALARIPGKGSETLADVLRSHQFQRFGSGIRFIITTDRASTEEIHQLPNPKTRTEWILLSEQGFNENYRSVQVETPQQSVWLWLHSPDSVPGQLLYPRKELIREL